MIDDEAAYQALASHDPRFDGVFFVGVTSTGIYCRPICPAKTPKQANCRFFGSAGAAEKAAFRPCLRCRPELAPGNAPVDHAQRVAHRILHRIDEELLEDGNNIGQIAKTFGISTRQLRRIVQAELGVSPSELIRTRRLLLAKQLLTETKLPVIDVAFASGFSSLRRFNDAFLSQYQMPPSRLRKVAAKENGMIDAAGTSKLQLSYRPPFNWEAMLDFLRVRAIKEVEWVTDESYSRTVGLGKCSGWIRVGHAAEKRALIVEFTHSLTPVLPALLGRLRNLFDLAARPDLIAEHLMKDPLLKKFVEKDPGLRVPGAFDGFEMAVRAVLGQQITVKAATTIACRFAEAFGEKIATPFPELTRLSPLAKRVAKSDLNGIVSLGTIATRSATILSLAQAFESGRLSLHAGGDPVASMTDLVAIPGIGPWTANYIGMRALRWPDAFPKEDIVIRNRLGGITAKKAEEMSQAWCPWRSYAVMHLWRNP